MTAVFLCLPYLEDVVKSGIGNGFGRLGTVRKKYKEGKHVQ